MLGCFVATPARITFDVGLDVVECGGALAFAEAFPNGFGTLAAYFVAVGFVEVNELNFAGLLGDFAVLE